MRHDRGARFCHFCVMGGTTSGLAGIVFTDAVINSTVAGNYIDNCFIEWSNEHTKVTNTGNVFGNLTIDGNLFFASDVLSGFNFIRVKPFANNTGLRDLAIADTTFRMTGGAINRVESIKTGQGNLNPNEFRNIVVTGNAFGSLNNPILNPCRVDVTRFSSNAAANWLAESYSQLPFGGRARSVEPTVATSEIRNTSGGQITGSPWVDHSRARTMTMSACAGRRPRMVR